MILFIFIDGIGLSYKRNKNPLYDKDLKFLKSIVYEKSQPLNAKMGIEGIPQSATGQSSIFTGENCSKILGYHKEGFPNGKLKKVLKEKSIFQYFNRRGLKSTFANGFIVENKDFLLNSRFVSTTTYMALSSVGSVRGLKNLNNNKAVYQDITNETIIDENKLSKRYEKLYPEIKKFLNYDELKKVKKIKPQKAAINLISIARKYNFTLFEYFLSDKAGHSGNYVKSRKVLIKFQNLLSNILKNMDFEKNTLIMTSDHGNVENLSISTHTNNEVPLFVKGKDQKLFEKAEYLYDIAEILKNNIHIIY